MGDYPVAWVFGFGCKRAISVCRPGRGAQFRREVALSTGRQAIARQSAERLWRAVDQNGQFIDFRLTARRDAKSARAFLKQAIGRVRLYRPVTICTDKAPGYRKVIQDLNHSYDPHFDSITHIDRKWRNNRIESDRAALKRLLETRPSFRSLRSAKATLMAIETIRTIKNGHIQNAQPGVRGEIDFVRNLFSEAA